jgi:hypothetical protein
MIRVEYAATRKKNCKDFMKFPKYYIGPMSKNVVDCVLEHNQPIGLIPSRRQVDFFGGYVNNWTTQEFVEYCKHKNSKVFLCRDHGGASQGQSEDDGYDSFKADSQHFHILHIDPFKQTNNIIDAAQITAKYINYCFKINSNLFYEVGTEQAIFRYEPNELVQFLNILKTQLPENQFNQIKYAVVQSGTGLDLSSRTNTGEFNCNRLCDFLNVVDSFGMLSKEHNGDYLLDHRGIEERFSLGLNAINIAPEFGQIETEYYLEVCKNDKELFDKFYEICYTSGKWKKWAFNLDNLSKDKLIMICGHYVLSNDSFVKEIKCKFPESDSKIKYNIKAKLNLLYEQTKNYSI